MVDRLAARGQTLAQVDHVSGERWYCIHTQPRREAVAAMHLAAQEFTIFLPEYVKTVRHARKLRTVKAALFPRYLFVRLDPDRGRWRSVNGTPGVTRLITAYERPAPVPHGVVEMLLDSQGPAGNIQFDRM